MQFSNYSSIGANLPFFKNEIYALSFYIGLAIVIAAWLPVRMVFFHDYLWMDALVDGALFFLAGRIFLKRLRTPIDPKEQSESAFWRFVNLATPYLCDVCIGLPTFSLLFLTTGVTYN